MKSPFDKSITLYTSYHGGQILMHAVHPVLLSCNGSKNKYKTTTIRKYGFQRFPAQEDLGTCRDGHSSLS